MQNMSINPVLTTNAPGSFNITSEGYIQGVALDDPASRNYLSGGVLADTETLPMWGGLPIIENVPGVVPGPNAALGGLITRSAAISTWTGFSVFNQAHHMVNSPQSPVPLALSRMGVHFYRIGSNARIPVACSPSLVNADGNPISSQVSWDFVNGMLVPYSPAYAQATITGATWAATAGGQTSYVVSTDLTTFLNAGDVINVQNIVQTGVLTPTGFNGQKTVVSVDATHVVVTEVGSVAPATYSSAGSIAAGGGAMPVRVLEVAPGNSMTVSFDPTTGFATWNRQGSTAVILI